MYNKLYLCELLQNIFSNEKFKIEASFRNDETNLSNNQLFFHIDNNSLTKEYTEGKTKFGYLVTFHRADFNPSLIIDIVAPIS